MKVYTQPGQTLPFHNGTGSTITSGTVVTTGTGIVGVVTGDILAGGDGQIFTEEVLNLPSDTGTAWTEGDRLYWDTVALKFTKTSLGPNVPAGFAAAAKLSAATLALVKLWPTPQAQGVFVAQVATAAATDLATSEALANQLKTSLNALLTSLVNAGVIAAS